MLYINSLMHCVYICLNVNFAYTITCIHAFPWYICLYQLAINYAHYQPYLYEFIVLYSTSNKLRPHFLFLVNLRTIHNRKHKCLFYFCTCFEAIHSTWKAWTINLVFVRYAYLEKRTTSLLASDVDYRSRSTNTNQESKLNSATDTQRQTTFTS